MQASSNPFFLGIIVIVIIFAAVAIFLLMKRSKKQKETGQTQAVSTASGGVREEPKQFSPCLKVSLTLNSSDVAKLKELGADFSSKLSGIALNLRDRIAFQGILIVVTQMEPQVPAVVSSDTNVQIRGTEDAVILNCPNCGTIQKEIRQTCSDCSTGLPVKIL